MHFHLDVAARVATITFEEGFLDDREVRALRDAVRTLTAEGNINLLVDLDGATHVNSTLIGAMVEMHTSYRKLGGHVVYARPRDSTQHLFTMLHLDQVFEITPSLEAAVERFE